MGEIGRKLRIEYHLLDKCNLSCKACSHFCCLVNKEELKTLEKISKDFEKIAKLTNNGSEEYVEKVTIMGGEPLLYPYVSEAITLIRSYFQNVDMYFLTNGTLLHKMDEDFWQSIIKNNITIAVSIYPINFDYSKAFDVLNKRCVRWYPYTIIKDNERVFDGRWLTNTYNSNLERHRNCFWRLTCTHLVDNKLYLCAMIAYFNYFDEYFKGQHNIKVIDKDYIDLDKINTWEELQVERDKIPSFCGHCRGLDLGFEKWDTSKKDINEWMYLEE